MTGSVAGSLHPKLPASAGARQLSRCMLCLEVTPSTPPALMAVGRVNCTELSQFVQGLFKELEPSSTYKTLFIPQSILY